jgi:hypothetical protein
MKSSVRNKNMDDKTHELAVLKAQARIRLEELKAQDSAKEVAGKAIGEDGLLYIFLIVLVGVGASLFLEGEKIAAVMGLLGASLTALIQMLNGIAGTAPKQEKPEFEVIKDLITRLDKLDRAEPPMQVDVEGSKVTVKKGADIVTAKG